MTISLRTQWLLRTAMAAGLAFIYVPLVVVVINSFNRSNTLQWPPQSFTTQWWAKMAANDGVRSAVTT